MDNECTECKRRQRLLEQSQFSLRETEKLCDDLIRREENHEAEIANLGRALREAESTCRALSKELGNTKAKLARAEHTKRLQQIASKSEKARNPSLEKQETEERWRKEARARILPLRRKRNRAGVSLTSVRGGQVAGSEHAG